MFAPMRLAVPIALALLTLVSCIDTPANGGGAVPAADTNWVGEVRMTKGDTSIRLCGSGKVYRLSGPDMDTLAFRYVHARMTTGQWMKVWCYGHIGAIASGNLMDSVLFAVKFQHLDASLHCDPIPDARVAGQWMLDQVDTLHPRDIRLHLFTDGTALMLTDLHQNTPALEEDGTWGMDVDDKVNVTWPMRQQTMLFSWEGGALVSSNKIPGHTVSMHKQGPADRLAGAFGRAARWLATTAAAQGHATKAEDLLPATTIAELFPTPDALRTLRTQALDTLALDDTSAALRLDAATTVRDYALLMRAAARR